MGTIISIKQKVMVLLILVIGLLPGGETGSTSTDYPLLEWVGSWPFGSTWEIEMDTLRKLCFMASGGGVIVVDVSYPSKPRIISDAIRPGRRFFSEPFSLINDYELSSSGRIQDLYYINKKLYVVGQRIFSLWDIEDPSKPICVIESLPLLDSCDIHHIFVQGNIIYCGVNNGVIIIRKRGNEFQYISKIELEYTPIRKILVTNNHLYICCGYGHVKIFDISNIKKPRDISTITVKNNLWDIALKNDILFIAQEKEGVTLYDVSNPGNPAEITSDSNSFLQEIVYPHKFLIRKNILFVFCAGKNNILIMDISNIDEIKTLATTAFYSFPHGIEIIDKYLFVTGSLRGVGIFDVSEGEAPRFLKEYNNFDITYSFDVNSVSMVVAQGMAGLHILDLSDATFPVLRSTIQTGFPIYDAKLNKDKLYVVDTQFLYVVDIIDIESPVIIARSPTPGARKIEIIDSNLVMIQTMDSTLYLYEINDDFHPKKLSSIKTNKIPFSYCYNDGYLYIASFRSLDIYRIFAGKIRGPFNKIHYKDNYIINVSIHSSCLYVLGSAMFEIRSIKNPIFPYLLSKTCISDSIIQSGCIITPRDVRDIVMFDNIAIFTIAGDGLRSFDVSNPKQPEQVSRISGLYYIKNLNTNNQFLYTCETFTGIQIFKFIQGSAKTE